MPLPDRAERAAVREKLTKVQQQRNADAFKANKYGDLDAEAVKSARSARQKAQSAAPKAGDNRVVPPSQSKSGKK